MATLRSRRFLLSGAGLAGLLTLAHATNDAFANLLPVLLPTLQERFSLGETAIGGLVAVISISSNVLQPLMGTLADRLGRRRVAAAGLIIGSVLLSLVAVVPNVWWLVALLAVGGLGSAAFHPSATSMARAAGRRKGLSIGLFTAGGPAGSALAPIVVLWTIDRFGLATVPYLAVPGIVMGGLLLALAPAQRDAGAPRRPMLDVALLAGPIGVLALVGVLRALAFVTFVNATPLWLVSVRGLGPNDPAIGWTLGAYSAAAAVGVALSGALEGVIGRRRLVVGSILLALPALAATLVAPSGSAAFYALVVLGGLLTNASVPLMIVAAQDLAPEAVAAASGMMMGFTWGSAGVLYIGMGVLQEAIGLTPAMLVGYGFLLPAAALAAVVLRPSAAAR